MTDSKITTRLRPDVDRRLRAAAALRRVRLSSVVNDALEAALPALPEIGAMVTGPLASDGKEAGGPASPTPPPSTPPPGCAAPPPCANHGSAPATATTTTTTTPATPS